MPKTRFDARHCNQRALGYPAGDARDCATGGDILRSCAVDLISSVRKGVQRPRSGLGMLHPLTYSGNETLELVTDANAGHKLMVVR